MQPFPASNGTFDANLVHRRVYLGSIGDAHCVNELRAAGVTHVLTAAAGVRASFPEHFKYLSLDVMDVGEESLENYFVEADEFLRDAPLALVHCMYGACHAARR